MTHFEGITLYQKLKAMKREIKFRAWDGKKMHKVCRLGLNGFSTDLWSPSPISCLLERTESLQLMQFTGLKDKNGKEIYEGDVLWSESWGNNDRQKNQYHIVEWNVFKWVATGYNGALKVSPDITVRHDFEVIGNVFENPELLK